MAVDTRQKRFSMMTLGRTWPAVSFFEADGSVDADDKAHLLGLYSGIALGEPVVIVTGKYHTGTVTISPMHTGTVAASAAHTGSINVDPAHTASVTLNPNS